METFISRQQEITHSLEQVLTNFKKDSPSRKTPEYIKTRVEALDTLWAEFEANDNQLMMEPIKTHEYYTKDIYNITKKNYQYTREIISSYTNTQDKGTQPDQKITELISLQRTNFRAFSRLTDGIIVSEIEEKWELEDELKALQSRWEKIDNLHWQIDNILQGSDVNYEMEFTHHETVFKSVKKDLNKKIGAMAHQQQATPKMIIPSFSGNYTQWPTFFDLFSGTIHNNPVLTKAQKMQHLKGKLQGEAERLIQHLNVSSDNYDTAWEILTHRYDNKQVLFTKQIECFLNQPIIQKQSSADIKKLHDTTMECIHAIHNLGIDTSTWDPLLVHLLVKKLDNVTYSDYMESRKAPRETPSFEEFTSFLEAKFTALEPLNKKSDETTSTIKQFTSKTPYNQKSKDIQRSSWNSEKTRSYQSNSTIFNCAVCNSKHALFQCRKFESMSPDVQLKTIAKHNICINCLYIHEKNNCNSTKRCKICDGFHNSLLHDAVTQMQATATSSSANKPQQRHNSNHVASNDGDILLTTVQMRVRAVDGTYMFLRALLDQGSQVTLITENAAQRLGLPRQSFNASISGVGTVAKKSKGKIQLDCKSIHNDFSFTTEALIMNKVLNNLPANSFDNQHYLHFQHLQLADPEYHISKPIDILLSAHVYSEIIMKGLMKGSIHQPIAQKTRMGWILSGQVAATFNCHVVINNMEDISQYWEMEDITTDSNDMTSQDQYCEKLFLSTTNRLPNGRYEVRIPMKTDFDKQLGTSKPQAVAQFKQLERKLSRDNNLHDSYHQFIHEYIALGHMKICLTNKQPECYLPHHSVIKQDSSTTKLRVVFNASAKTSSGHSLNDLMECGPKLQQDIQGLLLRWRTYKYVYMADCEKMYRMTLVHEDDQHLQKIIWRNSPHEALREYQLCTITYGMKAAPYLAMRVMKQLAKDESQTYPLAARVLENDFFVDDLLSGSDTIEQAQEVQNQLIRMLKGAGFNLRKWSSNSPKLLQDLSESQLNPTIVDFKTADSTKALGLRWNPKNDTFSFKSKVNDTKHKHHTKRSMLSDISKLFDPLGWLSPITIKAKLLFQRVWTSGIQWDDLVSTELQAEWTLFRDDLRNIDKFEIPRWIGNIEFRSQIHAFCDASEKVYACAIYLKTTDNNGRLSIRIIAAKTKLAPLNKTVTLPRLELCGALLLTRLLTKVKQALKQTDIETFAWTDSMIVLGWLQSSPSRWKSFVANRVQEIIEVVPPSCWRHTQSSDNAADCATRGLTPSQLKEHALWWEGPSWLKSQITDKTTTYDSPQIELKRKMTANTAQISVPIVDELLNKHSVLSHAVRVMCWVSRFITNARDRANAIRTRHLSVTEIENTYNTFIKTTQWEEYHDVISQLKESKILSKKSNILKLNPYLDENDILRVGGRLQHSQLTDESKHPIIIPQHSKLTELLIDQAHKRTLHGGPRLTLAHLRNKYWVVGGNRTVKKHIRNCVKCRRFSNSRHNQLMSNLPAPRVTPSRPFTHTGVDFTGFVELKVNKGRGIKTTKGYIAVFVCLATKAIHLELVSDLTSAAFLAALKRMCNRRGTPKGLWSDNATNFQGSSKILQREYKQALELIDKDFLTDIAEMGITWHFNAPAWPSAGGLWEAAVRSMKHHLKRILGDQKLTFEEFYTLLTQIEACLNSRPLYALTENIDDDILTPGHFLVGGPILSSPFSDINITCPRTRWQMTEKMHREFWKKWSTDYLHILQTRSKWNQPQKNTKINDIVLVKEDNMPPSKWALGRVTDIHPGKDGHVRVVTLKTKGGHVKRPIIKLAPLPVHHQHDNDKPDRPIDNPPRSKRSRKNKLPNVLVTALLLFMTCLTSTVQQQQASNFQITTLNNSNTLYFDKVAELGIIQDQWKIIVYYNLTTYWQSMADIKSYVHHISDICKSQPTFMTIAAQFEHELSELEHYNKLMTTQDTIISRKRRGLINGIGYVANSLFGVLDDRFARRYEQDIEIIGKRENHLFTLFKNLTSITEAENNILKRNENIMNKQFTIINNHLSSISDEMNKLNDNNNNALQAFYIVASAISADVIISNLRRIQETLIDTITDIYHGRLDFHLLSPKQIQDQLNIVSGQLNEDLKVPVSSIKDLYKLLKIRARVTSRFLIMEIRIPLINRDQFELDKIISVPQMKGVRAVYTKTEAPYIAVNIRNDIMMPMTEYDLQSCIKNIDQKMLCPINSPIYNIKSHESICDTRLFINNKNDTFCTSEVKECTDKWISLHTRDTWLFSCCQECTIRILCPAGYSTKLLRGSGLITIGQGCVIKGESFMIHAHHDYVNQMFIEQKIETPITAVSTLNDVINTSLRHDILNVTDHKEMFQNIQAKIESLRTQTLEQTLPKDSTHYIVTYTVLFVIIAILTGGTISKLKQRCKSKSIQKQTDLELTSVSAENSESKAVTETSLNDAKVNSSVMRSDKGHKSVNSVNKSTSTLDKLDFKLDFDMST